MTYSVAFPYFGGVSAPVLTNKPKIKEAEIVDVAYDGWKKERGIEDDDPFMFSHPGIMHVHSLKFNCMLNTFFHKGYTHCNPVKIVYKLLNDNS